jgi:hypothetical protein
MLIQNYGLFWLRDKVNWGTQGRGGTGELCGRYARQLKAREVDFREQQGVYVLYDDNFRIIYVGQTGAGNQRLFIRLRQHKRDHLAQRWNRFSWFGILPVENGRLNVNAEPVQPTVAGVLDHIEAILLASAEPPLNLQRGRFGENVEQYIQHIDNEDAGGE